MMPTTAEFNDQSLRSPDDWLLTAAKDGDLAQVKAALAAGGDIDARSYEDDTPLLRAAFENERKEVSDFLVENGSDLRAQNENEATVLMGFAKAGWVDLMQKAVDAGSPIASQDILYDDALSHAASDERAEAVAFLIRHGASPFRLVGEDSIALSLYTETTIQAAINAGMPVDASDAKGATILMHVTQQDNSTLVRSLLEWGADMHAADKRGWTPLAHAALNGAPRSFALLLESGARTDFVTQENETLERLLQGCDPDIRAIYHAWGARNTVQRVRGNLLASKAKAE